MIALVTGESQRSWGRKRRTGLDKSATGLPHRSDEAGLKRFSASKAASVDRLPAVVGPGAVVLVSASVFAVLVAGAHATTSSGTVRFSRLVGGAAHAGVAPAHGVTTRVSVASKGRQGNRNSYGWAISADRRYVAFESLASNLVPGDSNRNLDVFVRDVRGRVTRRVSLASNGRQGNGGSGEPAISADGRYVAFASGASTLVARDTNHFSDVFVRDRESGVTSRVSVTRDGRQGNADSELPAISPDGRYVVFTSMATNLVPRDTGTATWDVFVRDRRTGTTNMVSVASDGRRANSDSHIAAISADGRYVAFDSHAGNLVSDDTNRTWDVFVHDRNSRVTSRVSVASDGTQGDDWSQGAAISADGRYVAFSSPAGNLIAGDTNGWPDVFVHDRQSGVTSRVSVASDGTQGNLASEGAALSADGRYVAFSSYARNLIARDSNRTWDAFVHDRQSGLTSRVSIASNGREGNDDSSGVVIGPDGRQVAFDSEASNLVTGDTNRKVDVFVHDRLGMRRSSGSAPPGRSFALGTILYVDDLSVSPPARVPVALRAHEPTHTEALHSPPPTALFKDSAERLSG